MKLISTITTIFANRHKRAALLSLLALLFPAPCFAQDEEMSFRRLAAKSCHASCPAEIAADEIITKDSADAFRVVAKIAVPAAIVVHLASPGGSLVGSLQLGEAFREFNTTVIVGNGARCTSACVYALLGGAARRVTGGRVGVHRFRPENSPTRTFLPYLCNVRPKCSRNTWRTWVPIQRLSDWQWTYHHRPCTSLGQANSAAIASSTDGLDASSATRPSGSSSATHCVKRDNPKPADDCHGRWPQDGGSARAYAKA